MQKVSQLISDHLDLWTTAEVEKKSGRGRTSASNKKVYGLQKLRELILDLAISGKLIPEKDTDILETNVLKDIEIQINKLTKKGLLSKRKTLSPINDDKKLIKLPKNWVWIRIGNTGKIFNGDSINKDEKETKYTNIKEGRPFIATKDVGYGREKINYKNGVSIPFEKSKFKVAHKDAVLICSEGGSAGRKIGITETDICFGNKLLANETFSSINPRFIFYVYQSQSFYKSFSKRMTGIIGGISMNEFLNIPIPIPPFNQQNKIVSKIDELMNICDQLEQKHINSKEAHEKLVKVLLNILTESKNAQEFKESWQCIANHFDTLFITESSINELKESLHQVAAMGKLVPQDSNDVPVNRIHHAIEIKKIEHTSKKKLKKAKSITSITEDQKPFKLPESWEWVRWIDLTALDKSAFKRGPFGSHLKKDMFVSSGYKIYEQYCPINDDCSFERYFITKEKYESMKTFSVKANDFLISCSGSLGKITQVPEVYNEGIINQALLRVRMNNKLINNDFFKILFRSPYFQKAIFENATGSAIVNLKGVKELKKMPFPLVPIAEQHRIVSKFNELMSLCDELKSLIHQSSIKQNQIADVLVSKVLNSKEV